MTEHPARALATCLDCSKQQEVAGVVGVSPATPHGPADAAFYPDIEGSQFEACELCTWPQLLIDVLPSRQEEE